MSNYGNRPNGAAPDPSGPGKRLEHGAKPPLSPEEAKRRRERRIMIVMIAAAVVMVIAASAVLLYNRWFKKPSLPPGPVSSGAPSTSLQPGETPGPTLDIDAVQPKVGGARKSDSIYTFLVFGADVASGLTDSMMVVTYDVANQRAAVMSLPRDTLINVRRWNKSLNAVYSSYKDPAQGVEALKSEVSELVGFTPDYYVKIDWELVGEMVEAIGGVWFDVPRDMHYDDPAQDLHIHQDKGYRKLNGDDAMQIVRFRHSNDGTAISDITRLSIQHDFLKAVLKQTLQIQNMTKITQLADLFGRRVESDLQVENILWFGSQAVFGGLGVDDVEFFTMPFYGASNDRNARYRGRVYPNQTELLKVINEKLNPYEEEVTIRQLDLIRVSADGNTLSSSTGVLADPSAGIPPVVNTPEPTAPPESEPPASTPPVESEPLPTDPVETEPPPASEPPPETAPPAEPDPAAEAEPGADGASQ